MCPGVKHKEFHAEGAKLFRLTQFVRAEGAIFRVGNEADLHRRHDDFLGVIFPLRDPGKIRIFGAPQGPGTWIFRAPQDP